MIIRKLLLGTNLKGYIAGTMDGIVTVQGQPAKRDIWLLNAQTMAVEKIITSLSAGHYMFTGLNLNKRYVVIARDLPPHGVFTGFEPASWDWVTPASDLTVSEQQTLQASWQ